MKEIKFTTRNDTQMINGDPKHLALCPRCNNPVVVLGVYKQITPHERHAKERNIPGVDQYDEDKYEHCPYHRKTANYIKEYVPEIKEQQRQRLYESAFTHYDKDIIQRYIGICSS